MKRIKIEQETEGILSVFSYDSNFATTLVIVFAFVIGINLMVYALFGHDKRQSQSGGWRVPENTLLGLSILGGSIGAKFGQRKFRHKTKKQPFGNILNLILVAQILLAIALAIPQTRAFLLTAQ